MFPGPVFAYELRSVARKPRFYVIRALCGSFLLYLSWSFSWRWRNASQEPTIQDIAAIGSSLFGMTIWVQGLTAVLLTPALVAGTIAEDRQRKILHYLLASPLSSAEIVLGKLGVRLLYLVVLVMVGFPVMSLAVLLGGVEPIMLCMVELALLASIFFVGSLSMFLSSRLGKPRDAIIVTYILVFCWMMLPVLKTHIQRNLVPLWPALFGPLEQLVAFLAVSTPMGAVDINSSWPSSVAEGILGMTALNLIFGAGLLIPTVLYLRTNEQNEGQGRFKRIFGSQPGSRIWLRNRPFDLSDPMLWKECPGRFQFRHPAVAILARGLTLIAFVALAAGLFHFAIPAFQEVHMYGYITKWNYQTAREDFNGFLRFLTVSGYLLLVLILAAVSASSITSEKERDTWISLLTTPLEGKEIIRAKFLGPFWLARSLFLALVLVWMSGVVAGGLHPYGLVLLMIATASYTAFTVALGINYSSICRTSTRSLVATFVTLLVLNGGYLFCTVPILRIAGDPPSPFMEKFLFTGISPLIEGYAACTYLEADQFLNASSQLLHRFRRYNPEDRAGMACTYLFSVTGYGVAAFLLMQYRCMRFDKDYDRPMLRIDPSWYYKGPPPSEPETLVEDSITPEVSEKAFDSQQTLE